MIPILYGKSANDTDSYGIGVLSECVSCVVTEELNGSYEAVMRYPSSGEHYSDIGIDSIIKLKANDTDNPQLFRVYRISRPINGIVTYGLEHISYEMAKNPMREIKMSACTLQEYLTEVALHSVSAVGYNLQSDITDMYATYIPNGLSVRAALKAAADLWKTEMHFNNFAVVLGARGRNSGINIDYGVNLIDYSSELDYSEVLTHVYATATDKDGNVVSALVEHTAGMGYKRIAYVDFTSDFSEDDPPTYDKLRFKADDYIRENENFYPKASVDISFVPKEDETVHIGDYVTVTDRTGRTSTEEIVKAEYDCLRERYLSMTVGSLKRDASDILSSKTEGGKDKAEEAEEAAVSAMDIKENEVSFTLDDGSVKTVSLDRRADGKITRMGSVEVVYTYDT